MAPSPPKINSKEMEEPLNISFHEQDIQAESSYYQDYNENQEFPSILDEEQPIEIIIHIER